MGVSIRHRQAHHYTSDNLAQIKFMIHHDGGMETGQGFSNMTCERIFSPSQQKWGWDWIGLVLDLI